MNIVNLFRAYSRYIRHETFSFMMSLPAMSLVLRLCMSRKGGTGGGGWVHPAERAGQGVHPEGANSMFTSGLVFRSGLVVTGKAISILFGINGVGWHWEGHFYPFSLAQMELVGTGKAISILSVWHKWSWLALGRPFLSFLA